MRGNEVAMVFQDPMTSLNPVMRIEDQMVPPMMRHLGLITARGARAGAGAAAARSASRTRRARLRVLPARAQRRHAAARADRDRAVLQAGPDPGGRADDGAGRDDPGADRGAAQQLAEETGAAVLFVTHDLGLVARFAQKVAVMYAGRFVEYGPVREIFANPQHPYTRGLLRSIPPMTGRQQRAPGPDRRRAAGHEGAWATAAPSCSRCPDAMPPLRRRAAAADQPRAGHTAPPAGSTEAANR